MAIRPVFVPFQYTPFFRTVMITFEWHGGFAKIQSQKNIKAIHDGFNRIYPDVPVLEISSRGWQKGSKELSAFHMTKFVPELNRSVPVECIYQAGKVFLGGGPFLDLLEAKPKDAKQDARKKNAGYLVGYEFDGTCFPLIPASLFYNYLWINGLLEHPELAEIVLQYGAFTDIIFSSSSINCQAAAAAAFVALHKLGLLEMVKSTETFIQLLSDEVHLNDFVDVDSKEVADAFNLRLGEYKPVADPYAEKLVVVSKAAPKPKAKKPMADGKINVETGLGHKAKITESTQPVIAVGDVVKHKKFGEGKVVDVTDSAVKIVFSEVGEKLLGRTWVTVNCEIVGK